MKKLMAAALFLFIPLAYGSLYAQSCPRGDMGPGPGPGPGHGPGPHHGPHNRDGGMFFGDLERMKEVLNLSDKQIESISKINLTFKKKLLKYREELAPKRIRLERLLLEDTIDLSKVRSLLKEMSDIRIEIHMAKIEHRIAIEQVLTPQQRTKLKSERRMRMKHRKYDRKGIR